MSVISFSVQLLAGCYIAWRGRMSQWFKCNHFLILHGILQIKVGRKCIKSCTMNMNKLVDSVSDICKFIMHAKI